MPEFRSREVAVAVDMAGCPNRCRHCWLGTSPNRKVPVETVRWVVEQFRGWVRRGEERPFVGRLEVATWYREPDYAPNYRELWALEQELSDEGAARRFELLSIWRLARDEGYARWARQVGTDVCQISFFGLEATTDHFVRRRGYFRDALVATERLLAVGIRPRWQLFLTTRALPELGAFEDLIGKLRLEERVRALGGEFALFLNVPSPAGDAFDLEPLRPTVEDLARVPAYLLDKTAEHFGRPQSECLGRAEEDWLAELPACEEPYAPYQDIQAFFVTPALEVYSNTGELMPWWRLGNLQQDGIDAVMECYEDDAAPGLRVAFHTPVGELARAYGRPGSRRVYVRSELIERWMRLWGEEKGR